MYVKNSVNFIKWIWIKRKGFLFLLPWIIILHVYFQLLSNNRGQRIENQNVQISTFVKKDTEQNSSLSYIERIVKTAEGMRQRPVMVSLVNGAYSDLALNWLCNTKFMDVHEKVLVIVTNPEVKMKLTKFAPNIHVELIPVEKYLEDNLEYSRADYLDLLMKRTEILTALVENGIETFLFEFDFLWLKNPIPVFRTFAEKLDMVFTANYGQSNTVNGGFFYMFPTKTTTTVLQELRKMMEILIHKNKNLPHHKMISESENDQVYLSKLFTKRFGGLRAQILPFNDFPDGKFYSLGAEKKKDWKPYVIHNNWIIGNGNKVKRAKKLGHWFITEQETCNNSLVEHTLESQR